VDNQTAALADAAVALLLARLQHQAAPAIGEMRPRSRLIVRSSCASPPEASTSPSGAGADPAGTGLKPVPRPRRRAAAS
jgi:hypothetical protein